MKSRLLTAALMSSCLVALTGCPEDKPGGTGAPATTGAATGAATASASASAEVAARTVVVTDMDETLISKKSTGYVISFLVRLRSIRLLLVPLVAAVLIPVSKLSRTFAVRVMYWFAFRGVRVERAKAIAAVRLTKSA